jgi:O-antigen/teichoic acid export membrane protein
LAKEASRITSGGLLARNVALNLLGQAAPLLVALLAIPYLIGTLGTDRFGVLTLAWVAVGYFSLFDFGLSRALTQLVAERLGSRREDEIPALVWSGLMLMVLLGACGGALVAGLTPWLVGTIFNVPLDLIDEALSSFYLLAFALPWVISTAGLRGVLEAKQRFGLVNAVRVPMGIYTYLGPLLVLPFSDSLVPVIAVLVIGRVIAWIVHLVLCLHVLPELRVFRHMDRAAIRPLLRFGGWMTVSNVVGPIMVYFDRFLIGALLSVTAVAYYATPYEVVTKLWLVPVALMGVFFPAFATTYAGERDRFRVLLDRAVRMIFLVLFPVVFLLVLGAQEGLTLWLGTEFGLNSTRILQWLAVGVLINSIAQVPFSALQGMGRPDVTGKLHLVELPIYLALIWWLASTLGVEGVAIAWVLRVSLDTALLFLLVRRLSPEGDLALRNALLYLGIAAPVLGTAALVQGMGLKLILLVLVAVAFSILAWRSALVQSEREMMLRRFRAFREGGVLRALGF